MLEFLDGKGMSILTLKDNGEVETNSKEVKDQIKNNKVKTDEELLLDSEEEELT